MPLPIPRCAFVLPALLGFGACDLEVRSTRSADAVPAALQGEWVGDWSGASGTGGSLILQVQQFDTEPLVSIRIDNPCLEARDYELVVGLASVELRLDGDPVFVGVLGEGRTLTGLFECASGQGTWSATWQRELPELVDLSGTWTGSLSVPGASLPLTAQLIQEVRSGRLSVSGTMDAEGLVVGLPVEGTAFFDVDTFDLVLQTAPGVQPILLLTGRGDTASATLPLGLVQVLGGADLPFPQALVELARQP